MVEQVRGTFYHEFVDNQLEARGFWIKKISLDYMKRRLVDVMELVNSVRGEYRNEYGWQPEPVEYFLNPLQRKFDFSFAIEKKSDRQICFINFTSIYGEILHNHCTYAGPEFRGMNFAKLHIIKLCQTALDEGIIVQEGYWPKNNNASIILHLKMGWKIEEIRKNGTQLFMMADNRQIRDNVYNLLLLK